MKQFGLTAPKAVAPSTAPFFCLSPRTPDAFQRAYWPIGQIDASVSRFQLEQALWEQGIILQAQALWGQTASTDARLASEVSEARETIDQ